MAGAAAGGAQRDVGGGGTVNAIHRIGDVVTAFANEDVDAGDAPAAVAAEARGRRRESWGKERRGGIGGSGWTSVRGSGISAVVLYNVSGPRIRSRAI